ncbi:hypothetical protein ACFWA4_20610 [Streptomyces sp. NPDC060011]
MAGLSVSRFHAEIVLV